MKKRNRKYFSRLKEMKRRGIERMRIKTFNFDYFKFPLDISECEIGYSTDREGEPKERPQT
jgi:hypothetical protein